MSHEHFGASGIVQLHKELLWIFFIRLHLVIRQNHTKWDPQCLCTSVSATSWHAQVWEYAYSQKWTIYGPHTHCVCPWCVSFEGSLHRCHGCTEQTHTLTPTSCLFRVDFRLKYQQIVLVKQNFMPIRCANNTSSAFTVDCANYFIICRNARKLLV